MAMVAMASASTPTTATPAVRRRLLTDLVLSTMSPLSPNKNGRMCLSYLILSNLNPYEFRPTYHADLWTRVSSRPSAPSSTARASRSRPSSSASPSLRSASRSVRSRSGSASGSSTAPGGASSRPRPASGCTGALSGCSRSRSSSLEEVSGESDELRGRLEIGCLDRPRRDRAPAPALRVPAREPRRRDLALGQRHAARDRPRRGAASSSSASSGRRHATAAVDLRAVLPRRGRARLSRPAQRSPAATIKLDELRAEAADPHAGGRGSPAGGRGRAAGRRRAAARPRREARARAAGVGAKRGRRRPRRHVHLALLDRGRAGGRARSRPRASRGSTPRARSRSSAATGRTPSTGRGGVRRLRAGASPVIVRWGLDELPGVLASSGSSGRCSSRAARWDALELPRGRRAGTRSRRTGSRCREGVDGDPRGRRRQRDRHGKAASAESGLPLVSVPTTYSGSEWTPFFGVRDPDKRMVGGGRRREARGDRLRPGADARPAPGGDGGHRAQRARPRRRGALRHAARSPESDAGRARGRRADRRLASRRPRGPRARSARGRRLLKGAARAGEALGLSGLVSRPRDGAGARRPLRAPARRDERALPAARAAVQRARRAAGDRRLRQVDRRRRIRRTAWRSWPASAASTDCATSASREDELDDVAEATAQRGGAKANPRPASAGRDRGAVPRRSISADRRRRSASRRARRCASRRTRCSTGTGPPRRA